MKQFIVVFFFCLPVFLFAQNQPYQPWMLKIDRTYDLLEPVEYQERLEGTELTAFITEKKLIIKNDVGVELYRLPFVEGSDSLYLTFDGKALKLKTKKVMVDLVVEPVIVNVQGEYHSPEGFSFKL